MQAQSIEIPFQDIDSIPLLIKDFLNHKLSDFSNYTFSLENIKERIKEKKEAFSTEKRQILSQVLAEQYQDFELTQAQTQNLEALKESDTFSITTGHQLNLFTGPSFFIYKILQTIKTAEYLNQKLGEKVVPVFWMASEDHDFEEINHFKTPSHYYEFKAHSGGAVGRIKVEDQSFISEFEKEFKDTVFGTELILWMKEAYAKGNTLSQATRSIAQRLFASYGLLCIDGDHPQLKQQMTNIFRDELLHQSLKRESQRLVDFLSQDYKKVQVNPRDINLFYLTNTRNRIELQNENFKVVDTELSFTKKEMLAELSHPERISPNALMRPIYQETVLPNLAYIGGNAEIMYWLELKDYFQYLNLPYPILIPRNSMLFLTEKTLKKIHKLGLSINDFFRNFAQVISEQLLKNQPLEALLKEKENTLKKLFGELKTKASLTDISFRNLLEAEEKRQTKSFLRMQKRLLKAEKIKQSERLEQLERLFLEVHPMQNWQERVINFSSFYADEGQQWLKTCYEKMNVEKAVVCAISSN
ncbi:bacillithiol biosynthesis cysteine-adding enzyme BshC [Bergeyella cardium]|uniref:Putative cysteine ligase BshC n=1 Tax=Bergeyella cardium TaxID=1585976 RepID=A0A6P1QWJ1_9FLAO|nr:bacillithiol biosynthesis cysteine-adding enzyme BshC [Bergeyella cardium]QHN65074.1 bacillithiol biosynthesis cysteine-adding enzyme BshC [Bergeyella cardium]WHE34389.1 bacillithiol biosynthesis cysteine-adding enzyme BshC [Bergeyella cardium]WHF61040.1 bacillithiol biosynthesis cysteine-adding enzyme BshC [Bergeyella cardium]